MDAGEEIVLDAMREDKRLRVGRVHSNSSSSDSCDEEERAERPRQVGAYLLGSTIGTGCTGKVKCALHSETGAIVAIKILSRTTVSPDVIQREVDAWRSLSHSSIVSLREVMSSSRNWYLVSDVVVGGTLASQMSRSGGFEEEITRSICRQLASALNYCHSRGIAHRDIKPENCLLDVETGQAYVCDFGLAGPCNLQQDGVMAGTRSCGSPSYAAPCVLQGACRDGAAADAWSLGVLLYWMLSNGRLPFQIQDTPNKSYQELFKSIKEAHFEPLPESVAQGARDLVGQLLQVDPELRPSMSDLLEHPWLLEPQLVE
jgi:serine/threonine protein kinase